MATVGELIVRIGANVKQFVQGMQEAGRQARETANDISGSAQQMANNTQDATSRTGRYWSEAAEQARQMRQAMREASRAVREDYDNLTRSAQQYAGKTGEFMSEIEKLGKKQKKIQDEMIAGNERMKSSFLQSIGTMMARTNSAAKTLEHIQRVGNPLRSLDPMFLGLANKLETLAKNGSAAVVALRELGPTANMKQLQDLVTLIGTRLMGIQMLQLGAGLVTAGEVALLVKLANVVDKTLSPAFEKFKAVWLEALRPFGEMIAGIAHTFLDIGTAAGQFFVSLNQINPVLSQMVFGFLALIPPLVLILAPLAIGISAVNAYAAAFGGLWMLIGPVVTAFLAVIGTVMVVAAIIVGLIAVWNQMWQASENLRTAVTNAWTAIKDAIMNALAPLAPAWENLKSNFMDLIRTFVGGKDSNESIWKLMGDHVATFVTWVTQQLIPPLIAGINLFVQVLTFVMNTAAAVIKALASAWDSDFLFIRTIVMDTIDTVKDVISKGLDLIGNVCQAFINLFKGDWAGLWENVKAIVSDAIDLIWDWIQMWGIGKIFKFIGVIAGKYKAAFKELWSGIKNVFDDWLTTIYVKVDDAFKGILDFFNGLKSSFFDAGKNMLQGLADGLGNAVGAVVRKAQEVAQSVLNTVKSIFQIHSPSRVMMDVGFFVGEGLAIGMKNTMGMLQDVSGQVTNAATPFSTYSPTSTPAAATQSESSEINHFNFDRLFEGAVIQVRSDSDIKAIARELYNLTQSKGRGMGVR